MFNKGNSVDAMSVVEKGSDIRRHVARQHLRGETASFDCGACTVSAAASPTHPDRKAVSA